MVLRGKNTANTGVLHRVRAAGSSQGANAFDYAGRLRRGKYSPKQAVFSISHFPKYVYFGPFPMPGTEIAKAYDPSQVETRWYETWLAAKAFAGRAEPGKEAFCIVIPPPNVTGVLTMGHVLNNTIQDILVRRARQEGKAVLWLPGTDHAGLATQTRVEKELRKEGLDRRKMGREKFFQRVWSGATSTGASSSSSSSASGPRATGTAPCIRWTARTRPSTTAGRC